MLCKKLLWHEFQPKWSLLKNISKYIFNFESDLENLENGNNKKL